MSLQFSPGFLGLVVLGGAAVALAGEPETAGSPWEAADRLGLALPGISARGGWGETGMVTREAVPGEWESRLALGYADGDRFGGRVGWRRFWSEEADAADEVSLHAVLPRFGGHWGAGWSILRRGSRRATRTCLHGARRMTSGVIAGADLLFFPAAAPGGAEFRLWGAASRGPVLAGLGLGPGTHGYLLAVGVRIGPRVVWSAELSDLSPSLGISWGLGKLEFLAQSTRHPFLGAVTRFRIRWMGRR